jgi:hypothetical protein
VQELEKRETELRTRVTELERESTDLMERLRLRDEEVALRTEELGKLRDSVRAGLPPGLAVDPGTLSGDYADDVDRLSAALAVQSKRAAFLEEQARSLIERLENSDRRSAETSAAIASMRDALNARNDSKSADAENLIAAEARIASAENRLNALLAETGSLVEISAGRAEQLLADKLTLEAEVESLRNKVANVESSILADWDTERLEEAHLREKLNDIAASVSRLVYAVETDTPISATVGESLFDRVQRFADDRDTSGQADQGRPPRSSVGPHGRATRNPGPLEQLLPYYHTARQGAGRLIEQRQRCCTVDAVGHVNRSLDHHRRNYLCTSRDRDRLRDGWRWCIAHHPIDKGEANRHKAQQQDADRYPKRTARLAEHGQRLGG